MTGRAILPGLLALTVLAGCGADGEPTTPPPPGQVSQPGNPQVSTSVGIGIGVGASGTHVGGGVGFYQGPVSVFLGF